MRRRKRADWTVTVYRYHVRLTPEAWTHLPDGAKREIEATRSLWNQLVGVFAQRQARYREIVSRPAQCVKGRDAEPVRLVLRQLHNAFLAEVRRLTAECTATWANKEFLCTQFLSAVGRFLKRQGKPPGPKHGSPCEVHFHHRFTDGGLPITRIFGRGQRLHVEPVPPKAFDPALSQRQRKRLARTTGTFQAGDAILSFQTLLHRPLPQGGYLKAAALVGKQVLTGGYHLRQDGGHPLPPRWVWSLYLTVEMPPPRLAVPEFPRPTAAFSVSYRLWDDGHLQLGVLSDSTGREEALFLPAGVVQGWQHKRALQREADRCLEETKARLRDLRCADTLPSPLRHLLAHVGTMRAPGLWRLLQELEDAGASGAVLAVVQRWADRTTRLLREARGLERRYLGHREWFYRNVARQLCQRYRQLTVSTPDLRQRPSPIERPDLLSLPEAGTYRHLLAPSRFLRFLRDAAVKTGTEVHERRTAHASGYAQHGHMSDLLQGQESRSDGGTTSGEH